MNSQNYNRYSYVLNNPMSYTDPSGYFFKKLGKFVKKYWKPIVAAIAAVATYGAAMAALTTTSSIVTAYGTLSVSYATFGVGSYALAGAAAGAVAGAITTGSLKGTLQGAFSGAVFGAIGGSFAGSGYENGIGHIGSHAAAGGVLSDLQGGNFGHGFWTAGVMKGVGIANSPSSGASMNQIAGRAVIQAMVGGTLSKVTGGKFANGATSAAIQFVVNGLSESISGWVNKQKSRWQAARKVSAIDDEMSRLNDLYMNNQKSLMEELQTFHGFTGDRTNLQSAYISLSLDLQAQRSIALYTAASGMKPIGLSSVTLQGVKTVAPKWTDALLAWPLVGVASNVPYAASYNCGGSICSVEGFTIYD
jgi:hypothetical protein